MKTLIRVTLLLAMFPIAGFAQIPRTLSYQGVLTDSLGTPKPDGTYSMTFRLYDVPSGGNALWSEQKTLTVKRGLFTTMLGDQVVFGQNLLFDKPYWLSIQVAAGAELAPRIPFSAVGYSFNSLKADTAQYAKSSPPQVPGGQASGDLSGTYPGPTVARLQNRTVASTAPTNGQVLKWDAGATQWVPAADATGSGGINGSGTLGQVAFWNSATSLSGNSNLFWDNTNSRLGIGMPTPLAPLHLFSNSTSGGGLFVETAAGAGGRNWYIYGSGSANAIGRGKFAIRDQALLSDRFVIDSSGNIGIGTTNPTAILDVSGTLKASGFYMPTGAVNNYILTSDAQGIGAWRAGPGGSQWITNGSDIYFLNGNVGIGRSSPSSKLDIVGSEPGIFGISSAKLDSISVGVVATSGVASFGYNSGVGGVFVGKCYGVQATAVNRYGERAAGLFTVVNNNGTSSQVVVGAVSSTGSIRKIEGTGTVNTVMKTRRGAKALFAPESPEAWFEDFGFGQLTQGHARIELDPLYLDCVTITKKFPIHVFVQLNDDCSGVYVRTDLQGFDVYELRGGTSNAQFSYRIVAKWKGYEDERFPDPIAPPELVEKQIDFRR